MGNIIAPQCAEPEFMMSSAETSRYCSRLNMTVFAVIADIIILIIIGVMNLTKIPDLPPEEKAKEVGKRRTYTILLIIAGFAVWALVPLFGWIGGQTWSGEQQKIQSYVSQGVPRQEAMRRIQNLYQAEMQAAAIRDVASALRSREGKN